MMKKLIGLVQALDELDGEDVIFARPEWTLDSDADVFHLGEDGHKPSEPGRLGLEYFLEVEIAREVLEEFEGQADVGDAEKCERLIHYAKFDA